jgi:hypothetical protein
VLSKRTIYRFTPRAILRGVGISKRSASQLSQSLFSCFHDAECFYTN